MPYSSRYTTIFSFVRGFLKLRSNIRSNSSECNNSSECVSRKCVENFQLPSFPGSEQSTGLLPPLFTTAGFNKSLRCTLVVFLLAIVSPCSAEYIFSAPPREDPQKGHETYGPLVNYLSFVLGEKVIYEHPEGWAEYANRMRSGHYDIVFDGPHFGAWRMKNISHVPVAALPGNLGFVVVSKKSNRRIRKVRDLLAVEICALASPNLGTMTVYNLFNNPVLTPRIYEVKGGFAGVYNALKQDKCQAAVLRNTYYHKLDPKEKDELLLVTATKPIPNQTITVGQRLYARKELISQKLVSTEGKKAAANLLKRFGGFPKSLHNTKIQDYENLENLLTGVVWGW